MMESNARRTAWQTPVCSVCIANYNGESMLGDCIDSVLAQKDVGEVEIIVHDDASTDDSLVLLRERYPMVRLIVSGQNVGFCVSNNRMVAVARGDYVLLLNNDAALFPNALATLLEVAHSQTPKGILTLPQYDWRSGDLVDRGCLLDPFYNPVPNLDPSRASVTITIGACLFLQRALWDELGGFPEWIGSIAEDMYLCCLSRLRGYTVSVTSTSGYRHRQGASFGGNRVDAGKLSTTYRRRALSERNKTAVMIICTPTALVWPLLVLHFIVLVVEGVILTALKRSRRVWLEIYWPTLGYILRAPVRLRVLRQDAQRVRNISLGRYMKGFSPSWRKVSLLWRHGIPEVR
ncbi:MAG: glycosyltransferase [Rhodanobacter sp.]|nr:MAG: glycosyltransferase [Rhodanobacter sp.]